MYEQYWRLSRPAFENDVEAAFYFPGSSHHGALLKLRYLIENRKGVGLFVGGHGAGKTYLTHVLEQEFDDRHRPFARILFPQLDPMELLSHLAQRLGAIDSPHDTSPLRQDRVLHRLEQRLEMLTADGRHPVLIVDEAHLLEPPHLLALQLLLNYQQEPRIGFSLILMGQPELLPHVQRFAALESRVTVKTALRSLTEPEIADYIRHRLAVVGRTDDLFGESTVRSFAQLSQGNPRRLNQLCDLALLVGYADGLERLTPVEIEAAAEELACVSID